MAEAAFFDPETSLAEPLFVFVQSLAGRRLNDYGAGDLLLSPHNGEDYIEDTDSEEGRIDQTPRWRNNTLCLFIHMGLPTSPLIQQTVSSAD